MTRLQTTLATAFSLDAFHELLRTLGVPPGAVAMAAAREVAASNLIQWADTHGRTADLLAAVRSHGPDAGHTEVPAADIQPWQLKLDPYSRMQLEDGFPGQGADVMVRLGRREKDKIPQLADAGLVVHSQSGEIVTGRVASAERLQDVARLQCVEEVQLSRPLYAG